MNYPEREVASPPPLQVSLPAVPTACRRGGGTGPGLPGGGEGEDGVDGGFQGAGVSLDGRDLLCRVTVTPSGFLASHPDPDLP